MSYSNRNEKLSTKRAIVNGDTEALAKSMTERMRRFCHEYIQDFNPEKAVLRAGYLTKYPRRQAYNLLRHEGIKAYIEEVQTTKVSKITAVDPNYVIGKITAIVSDPDAKHADQLRGLELLAKHLGMFIDRQELTGKDGGPLSVVQEETRQEAEELVGLLQQLHVRKQKENKEAEVKTGNVIDFNDSKKVGKGG